MSLPHVNVSALEKTSSAPRGVAVTWIIDDQVKENLIQEHFDDKDTTLLGDKSVIN